MSVLMKSIHQLVIILSQGPRDDVTTIFISIQTNALPHSHQIAGNKQDL